ncbi:MAG: hypothetical protein Q8M22_03330 [Actinomycetota bacterium]|nr:hypothetical protein [Actinomycetota bacterium]
MLRDAVIETSKTWGDQPYWRKLSFPRTPLWNTQVLAAMFKLDGSDYPGDAEMLLTYLLGRQGIANATTDMFCSEMIAATCMMVGLLQEVHPPNFYAPRDFSSEPNATLPLVPAATLATELKVVLPPD